MRFCFISFIQFVYLCSTAQTKISGTVRNDESTHLAYATVSLMSVDSIPILSTTTSELGSFEFSLPDTLLTKASYIMATYLKDTSELIRFSKNQVYYNILIPIKSKLLGEVIVNNKRPSLQRRADRFLYTPGKNLSVGSSVFDIIRFAPLLTYDAKRDFFSIINKEGTVIYINNRRTLMPQNVLVSLLKSTPAENINNIEIITNPGSEYEAGTTGGIININLKKAFNEGWSAFLSMSTEQILYSTSYNTSNLNGTINFRKNKTGIKISPFYNNSFNFSLTEDSIVTEISTSQRNDITTYRRYKVAGANIGIDYDLSPSDMLSFNGLISKVNGRGNQNGKTLFNTGSLNDSTYTSPVTTADKYLYNYGNIYYQHDFDSLAKRKITFNIDYNHFYHKNIDDGTFNKITTSGEAEILSKYRNELPQQFFNISGRIDYSFQLNNSIKVNTGLQYSNTNVSSDLSYLNYNFQSGQFENTYASNEYQYKEQYAAAYIGNVIQVRKKWDFVVGIRAETISYTTKEIRDGNKADTSYVSLFPNISFAYNHSKNENISFSFSRKIKRSNIELLFPGRRYYNAGYFTENNPFLQPVTYYNAEMMYALKNRYFISGGHTLYLNQYTRFVVPHNTNGENALKSTYLNYGEWRSTYFTAYSRQQTLQGKLSMNIAASVYHAQFIAQKSLQGIGFRNIQNWNFNASFNSIYTLSEKNGWTGFLYFQYNSPIRSISLERENALASLDIGLRKTFGNISASFFLTDIFNTNSLSTNIYEPNQAYHYNKHTARNFTRTASLTLSYFLGNNKLKTNKNKTSANEEIRNRVRK